jgi:hypothetical protein
MADSYKGSGENKRGFHHPASERHDHNEAGSTGPMGSSGRDRGEGPTDHMQGSGTRPGADARIEAFRKAHASHTATSQSRHGGEHHVRGEAGHKSPHVTQSPHGADHHFREERTESAAERAYERRHGEE